MSSRVDPMPELLPRTFAEAGAQPASYRTMNGPSVVPCGWQPERLGHRGPAVRDRDSTLVTSGRHDEATPLIAETVHRVSAARSG